jgi:Flp pilus assembly protein TadG
MELLLKALFAERRGNVAMMFGLAVIPLLGMAAAAVDYSRAGDAYSRLQAAVDSTTLALARLPPSTTQAALQTQATNMVKAFMRDPAVAATLTVTPTRSTTSIVVSATGRVATPLVSLIGINSTPIVATSTAMWGNTRLRVALALDVTGSMNSSNKLTALKTATSNLLTQLQNAATTNGDVYVSIVPFAKDVNIGSSNFSQSWVKWSGSADTWDENNGVCSEPEYDTKSSCNAVYVCSISGKSSASSCTNAAVCSISRWTSRGSCNSHGGTWTNGVWAQAVWTPHPHATWNGCVMDRDQNYDTTNTAPTNAATNFPAEQYAACPPAVMPLSYDWTALNAKVTGLVANGGTNQAIGLAHAFQTLTASPYTVPALDPAYQYTQAIILLSDGLNTQDRWYGNGVSPSPEVDARQAILCANVKAAGIVVYTVQVNTDGDPTSTLLQSCASDSGKFFLLTSADEIVTTFSSIGTSLSNLRVAR